MQGMNIHVHILHGGSPANFLDLGGGVKTPQVYISHIYVQVYICMCVPVHICNVHTYVWIKCMAAHMTISLTSAVV